MSDRKKYLLLILCISIPFIIFSSSALAVNFIHGNFTISTNACRVCHIFHDAPFEKLLVAGPSQTQFCYLCHGNGATGSPYDVQGGVIAGIAESSAGGFDTVGGFVYGTPVTSRHMVDGYMDNSTGFETGSTGSFSGQIPGSGNIIGSLVCTSCHNPHGGGEWGPNPRLLKTVIQEVYDLFVEVDEISIGQPDGETWYQATQISGYKKGFTAWCSSCHDLLGSGHSGESGLFGHATDVTATIYASYNTTVGPGIPLEDSVTIDGESTGLVTCMTCHRSHGTTAEMTDGAESYQRIGEDGTEETVFSSVLLRINNRGVCYACHGAASTNTPVSE